LIAANGNRYEGNWELDTKHGIGTFFYTSRNQKYHGEWKSGTTPNCKKPIVSYLLFVDVAVRGELTAVEETSNNTTEHELFANKRITQLPVVR
jgi:hypothetical protein